MIEGDMKTVLGQGVLNRRKMNSGVFQYWFGNKVNIFIFMDDLCLERRSALVRCAD